MSGTIEIDDTGPEPRVRITLPQEWFTVSELRQFAAYLAVVADEAVPSPELERLAGILETAQLLTCAPRDAARAILRAGYELTERPSGDN